MRKKEGESQRRIERNYRKYIKGSILSMTSDSDSRDLNKDLQEQPSKVRMKGKI